MNARCLAMSMSIKTDIPIQFSHAHKMKGVLTCAMASSHDLCCSATHPSTYSSNPYTTNAQWVICAVLPNVQIIRKGPKHNLVRLYNHTITNIQITSINNHKIFIDNSASRHLHRPNKM